MDIETSTPVTALEFCDRTEPLAQLRAVLEDARRGVRRWVAVMGQRKIGKTSLLLELLRQESERAAICYVDCWEVRADPLYFLRGMIRQLILTAVRCRGEEARIGPLDPGADGALSAERIQALAKLDSAALDRAVTLHQELAAGKLTVETIAGVLQLPQAVAADLGTTLVVVMDEFQELDRLRRIRRLEERVEDPFGFIRGLWQRQKNVSYMVAGSRVTLLRQILTEEREALFQHFEMLELGPFPRDETLTMLARILGSESPAEEPTVRRILDLLGDHPFYVRVVAQEAVGGRSASRSGPDETARRLKEALQASLFEQNGRLSLFMEQRYRLLVGESSLLEAVLRGFVRPARPTDVAEKLHVRTGAVGSALKTLMQGDALRKRSDGLYEFTDPTFALWLEHQVDFRQAMPPLLVGNDAEQTVGRKLAAGGFRGVYQSRASRGAFDLLAIHDTRVFGLQVKKRRLPCTVGKTELNRLREDARRLGFHPVLAVVSGEYVRFYDLQRAPSRTALRITARKPHWDTLLALL